MGVAARLVACLVSIGVVGGYGQNQLYYGCAHRPILQSAGGWSGGREARKDYETRSFGCNRECVHFKLEVGEGCVWPSPPSRLQWLASSPPTSLVDRRPARGCGRAIGCVPSIYRSGGGYGQNPTLLWLCPPSHSPERHWRATDAGWWEGRCGPAASGDGHHWSVRGRPAWGRRGKARRSQAVV